MLFTQDSTVHQSYKFTLGKLKSFVGKNACLDSTFSNTNNCIPEKQIKNGDSIYYHNTFGEIFGDTTGTIGFCDASSEFPNLASQVFSVDGNTFDVDTSMNCSTGYEGGYSYTQNFPVDVNLCPNGYVSEVRVKAFISNIQRSDANDNGVGNIVLALNVNGQNVNADNTQGGGVPPSLVLLGNINGDSYYEFIYKQTSGTINSVRATVMWLGKISFNLDGLKVIYKIADCPCYQQFLTTDSLGCMKLDSVISPDPFTLQATNGLSLQGENKVKLGGTINQNTTINGGGNQLQFNGFGNINFNTNYWDENNPNISYNINYSQSGSNSYQSAYRGDNANNTNESSSQNIAPNNINQYYNFQDNDNSISKSSQSQVSDNITQSSSYSDNINGINNYTSSQFSSSGYTFNTSNYITNEYSNHTLSPQNVAFNTYGANNNFTGYNQTQNEIGIKVTDYSQSGITQFRLTPLAMYLQTHKIYSNNATVGQVLTLKDANTGEVEFEDISVYLDSLNNLDTNNYVSAINGLHKDSSQIKLGGTLVENTDISLAGYNLNINSPINSAVNINKSQFNPYGQSLTILGTINNTNNFNTDRYYNVNSGLSINNSNIGYPINTQIGLGVYNSNVDVLTGMYHGIGGSNSTINKSIFHRVDLNASTNMHHHQLFGSYYDFASYGSGHSVDTLIGIYVPEPNVQNNNKRAFIYLGGTIGNFNLPTKFSLYSASNDPSIFRGSLKIYPSSSVSNPIPRSELDIEGTGAIIVPVGTTSQRPTTPVQGMIRFNSQTGKFEGYDGTNWVDFH